MNYKDAKRIIKEFDLNATPMGEDFFLYTEAMDFLIRKENDPYRMMLLAAEYAVREKYDLARKYYEKAAAHGEPMAIESLGEIYYRGQGVDRNLGIAADYAKQAYETDDKFASFFGGALLAKIYSAEDYNGRNMTVSRKILEELNHKTDEDESLRGAATDVFEALADMYLAEGDEDKALPLYLKSKYCTAENLAMRMVPYSQRDIAAFMEKLHRLSSYQPDEYDLYDLYWLMKEPVKVRFGHDGERFLVKSFYEDGEIHIKFGSRAYRSVADFIERAEIDGTRIQALFFELDSMEVVG